MLIYSDYLFDFFGVLAGEYNEDYNDGGIMKIRKTLITLLAFATLAAACIYAGTVITPGQLQTLIGSTGSWAALAYIGLFTLLPAFFFPVAVLALAGGLLFGLWWGSLYTFIGAMLNCTLMFLLARYVGRDKVEQMLRDRLSVFWQEKLKGLEGRSGFLILVILRLIPAVPYNLINYSFGLTGMGFTTYLIGSAIGIIPGTLAFINIGDKALDVTSPDFWIAVGLLGGLLLVTSILGKFAFPDHKKNGELK